MPVAVRMQLLDILHELWRKIDQIAENDTSFAKETPKIGKESKQMLIYNKSQ